MEKIPRLDIRPGQFTADVISRDEAIAAAEKDNAAAEQRGVLAGKVQAFEEMGTVLDKLAVEAAHDVEMDNRHHLVARSLREAAVLARKYAAKAGEKGT